MGNEPKTFVELDSDVLESQFTKVFREDEFVFNAPHEYRVTNSETNETIDTINFQKGPLKENPLNGIFIEDLLAICVDRLAHFQKSEFSCRENAVALTKIEEAMMWLYKRKNNRVRRGVQGYNKK